MKKNIAVLAGSRAECLSFASGKGSFNQTLWRLETADAVYRFHVEERCSDGISADELLKIGTYERRFTPHFVAMAEIGCEMYRRSRMAA